LAPKNIFEEIFWPLKVKVGQLWKAGFTIMVNECTKKSLLILLLPLVLLHLLALQTTRMVKVAPLNRKSLFNQ